MKYEIESTSMTVALETFETMEQTRNRGTKQTKINFRATYIIEKPYPRKVLLYIAPLTITYSTINKVRRLHIRLKFRFIRYTTEN